MGEYGTAEHEAELVAWEREVGDGYPEPPTMAQLGGDLTAGPEDSGYDDSYRCIGCGELLKVEDPFTLVVDPSGVYSVHDACKAAAEQALAF